MGGAHGILAEMSHRPQSVLSRGPPTSALLSQAPPPLSLVALQVNITLLDINDNHPTWKDAPYYINLVEMTPPDSDVTTVSGGGGTAELPGCPARGVCHSRVSPTGRPMWDRRTSCFPLSQHHGAEFWKLSCVVEGSQRLGKSPRLVLRGSGLLQALSKGARAAQGQR